MLRYKCRYLGAAQADLLSIVDYIAEDNPRAADKMLDRFEKALDRLELSPFVGKVPNDDELRDRNSSHAHCREVPRVLQNQRKDD